MMPTSLRNDRGSVVIMVLIIAVIFAIIVADLSSRFVNLTRTGLKYAVANENLRVADELSKIVSKAYEKGAQSGATCPTGTTSVSAGATLLCFEAAAGANCVKTPYGSGSVCLDVSTSHGLALNDESMIYRFDSYPMRFEKDGSLFASLFPQAQAAVPASAAMPPMPSTVFANTAPAHTCAATDVAACRKCGPGESNICFQISYCPVNNSSCTSGSADQVKIDMMIERTTASTSAGCPAATGMTWTAGASTCNGSVAATAAGDIASSIDNAGNMTGSANFQCTSGGTWDPTPLASSCTTPPPSGSCVGGTRRGPVYVDLNDCQDNADANCAAAGEVTGACGTISPYQVCCRPPPPSTCSWAGYPGSGGQDPPGQCGCPGGGSTTCNILSDPMGTVIDGGSSSPRAAACNPTTANQGASYYECVEFTPQTTWSQTNYICQCN